MKETDVTEIEESNKVEIRAKVMLITLFDVRFAVPYKSHAPQPIIGVGAAPANFFSLTVDAFGI